MIYGALLPILLIMDCCKSLTAIMTNKLSTLDTLIQQWLPVSIIPVFLTLFFWNFSSRYDDFILLFDPTVTTSTPESRRGNLRCRQGIQRFGIRCFHAVTAPIAYMLRPIFAFLFKVRDQVDAILTPYFDTRRDVEDWSPRINTAVPRRPARTPAKKLPDPYEHYVHKNEVERRLKEHVAPIKIAYDLVKTSLAQSDTEISSSHGLIQTLKPRLERTERRRIHAKRQNQRKSSIIINLKQRKSELDSAIISHDAREKERQKDRDENAEKLMTENKNLRNQFESKSKACESLQEQFDSKSQAYRDLDCKHDITEIHCGKLIEWEQKANDEKQDIQTEFENEQRLNKKLANDVSRLREDKKNAVDEAKKQRDRCYDCEGVLQGRIPRKSYRPGESMGVFVQRCKLEASQCANASTQTDLVDNVVSSPQPILEITTASDSETPVEPVVAPVETAMTPYKAPSDRKLNPIRQRRPATEQFLTSPQAVERLITAPEENEEWSLQHEEATAPVDDGEPEFDLTMPNEIAEAASTKSILSHYLRIEKDGERFKTQAQDPLFAGLAPAMGTDGEGIEREGKEKESNVPPRTSTFAPITSQALPSRPPVDAIREEATPAPLFSPPAIPPPPPPRIQIEEPSSPAVATSTVKTDKTLLSPCSVSASKSRAAPHGSKKGSRTKKTSGNSEKIKEKSAASDQQQSQSSVVKSTSTLLPALPPRPRQSEQQYARDSSPVPPPSAPKYIETSSLPDPVPVAAPSAPTPSGEPPHTLPGLTPQPAAAVKQPEPQQPWQPLWMGDVTISTAVPGTFRRSPPRQLQPPPPPSPAPPPPPAKEDKDGMEGVQSSPPQQHVLTPSTAAPNAFSQRQEEDPYTMDYEDDPSSQPSHTVAPSSDDMEDILEESSSTGYPNVEEEEQMDMDFYGNDDTQNVTIVAPQLPSSVSVGATSSFAPLPAFTRSTAEAPNQDEEMEMDEDLYGSHPTTSSGPAPAHTAFGAPFMHTTRAPSTTNVLIPGLFPFSAPPTHHQTAAPVTTNASAPLANLPTVPLTGGPRPRVGMLDPASAAQMMADQEGQRRSKKGEKVGKWGYR